MDALPALRLTSNLNALLRRTQTLEQAERAVRGSDVAHHVADPDGVLGLDPLQATPLDDALPTLVSREREAWFLALPAPGLLAPLRGPLPFNHAALQAGEAVIAAGGGVGLVPYRTGPGVQWRVFAAERPFAPASPYDAERALGEAIIAAADALTTLDVAAGERPRAAAEPVLPPGYGRRATSVADRAARMLQACDIALADDGASVTAYEVDRRFRELRTLRNHAAEALCSAVGWLR